MAPVLLCPECGTKHPLDDVTANAFPCTGCGRTLKVPAQAREMTSAGTSDAPSPLLPPPLVPPVPEAHSTHVLAPVPPEALAPVASAPPLGPPQGIPALDYARERPPDPAQAAGASSSLVPPAWVRLLLWLVAVPLAFFVVFSVARVVGLLTTRDITDVALAEGWRRFMPIVRLLPFVALATALFVTGGVYGVARLRGRQGPKAATGGRPSARSSPRQSSRTGA